MPKRKYYSSYRRRRRRRNRLILAVLLIALLVGGACLWYLWSKTNQPGTAQPEFSMVSGESSTSAITEESKSSAPLPEISEPSLPEPESSLPETGSVYDFSQPVPESEPVGEEYFDDALFIGDSRTQGFILYSGLAGTTSYADKGLSVDKVFTKEIVAENGANYTVADALAHHQGKYQKVYLMFGVNELGWSYPEIFQQKYREVVQKVRETQPDAVIYVQSVLPVSRAKSDGSDIYNMERVNLFNRLLKEMAEEEQVCYLDVAAGVADAEGYLPDDASTDGVHLNKDYCLKWLGYLETHTVPAPPSGAPEGPAE